MPLPRLHPFKPRIVEATRGYSRDKLIADLGAGLTVGIVALPLALAFGIASGVQPEQGLITAIVAGFLISALGGSQVQIGGPAGAFIVIVFGIIDRYGYTGLVLSTVMAGVLMVVLGALRLGVLIRYIPVAIVIGFTNGIAVLIALSQVRDFLGLEVSKMPADFLAQVTILANHLTSFNPWSVALGVGCVAVLVLWGRITAPAQHANDLSPPRGGWRLALRLPGPIVALVLLTLIAWGLKLPVATIGSRFGELQLALPTLDWPPLNWDSAKHLTIPTITIALLGSIESLLCARVADNLGSFKRHDPNQELMAQGIANIVTPLVGGIPATGTIARTVTNVRAGAVSPVAGLVHAATLLLILLMAAPLASHVPLAVLAGILVFMAWNMFEGHHFLNLRRFPATYRINLIGTFLLTIVFDLTVAVEVGLVLACLFFIWRMSTLFDIKPLPSDVSLPDGVHGLAVYGSLFFGAVGKVENLAEQVPAGTRWLLLDMQRLVSIDTSGLDAMQQLRRTLKRQGIGLALAQVNEQPLGLMRRSGFVDELGEHGLLSSLDQARVRFAARVEANPIKD